MSEKNNLNIIMLNFFYRVNSVDCQITRKSLYNILDNYLDKIRMHEINFDQNKEICDKYNVYGVPTILIIENKVILGRYSGLVDSGELNSLLELVIKNIP